MLQDIKGKLAVIVSFHSYFSFTVTLNVEVQKNIVEPASKLSVIAIEFDMLAKSFYEKTEKRVTVNVLVCVAFFSQNTLNRFKNVTMATMGTTVCHSATAHMDTVTMWMGFV